MARWTSSDLQILKAKHSATKPKKAKHETAGLTGMEAIEARRNAIIVIGIDPGTNTGIAVKRRGILEFVETHTIWRALNIVKELAENYGSVENVFVRIEDARQRTWFGKTDRERLKGAGSVERDCNIWEEVLTELQITFELIHPKRVKATTPEQFDKLTGWKERTSIHAREAAWLII